MITVGQKLTWVSVRTMLQNCSPLNIDDAPANIKNYCALTMSRQLYADDRVRREILAATQELMPNVRSGKLVPFKDLGRHISGSPWCTDIKSKEILLLLLMCIGHAEIRVGDRGAFIRIWE